MTRRLVATVACGAIVFGASAGIAAGLVAVGLVRRFGPAPARPTVTMVRWPGESAEVFAARCSDAIRRGRQS